MKRLRLALLLVTPLLGIMSFPGAAQADLGGPMTWAGFCIWGEEHDATGKTTSHHADDLGNCAKAACGLTMDNPENKTACTPDSTTSSVTNCVTMMSTSFHKDCTCGMSDPMTGKCTDPYEGFTISVGANVKYGIITVEAGFSVAAKKKYWADGDQCQTMRRTDHHMAGMGSWVDTNAEVNGQIVITANSMIKVNLGVGGGEVTVSTMCARSGNPKQVMKIASTQCTEQ